MNISQYITTRTVFPDTHHHPILPDMPRTMASVTHPLRTNCVILIHHFISSLSACIVENNVTYQRTPKHDRWRPAYIIMSINCVITWYKVLCTNNVFWRSVPLAMMTGQMKYVSVYSVLLLIYTQQRHVTTRTAWEDSFLIVWKQQVRKITPILQQVSVNPIWHWNTW